MGDVKKLLNPKTIALIGATDKEGTPGRIALENVLQSKERRIFPVNPGKESLLGLTCYPTIADIPEQIDLAVIATPADTVPDIVHTCGETGVEGIIIVSAGFREVGPVGQALEDRIREIRRKFGMRIIGPNSLGIIRPNEDLNASILPINPEKGNVAFVSQSGAFGRALLDWGIGNHIGFSMFASLGSMIDVDFSDLIDFLGDDPHTRSIMIYVERDIGNAKKFTSAAKGFARNRPIIALRPGMPPEEEMQTYTYAGMLADTEYVYDAVFKRIGVVGVKGASDLFNTASALSARHLPQGPRLLIITNSYGVGIMAKSALLGLGGEIAMLSAETIEGLSKVLPPYWKQGNPLDILRDADAKRFSTALRICLQDHGADGVLVIFTPQGIAAPDEIARAVADVAKAAWKPVITTWMGGGNVQEGREALLQDGIPTYNTPEEAVKTYLYMYNYKRNLEVLYETPAELPVDLAPPKNNLKSLIRLAIGDGTTILNETESMRFLTNYGIPVIETHMTRSIDEAVSIAQKIGYPIALKVSSPDILFRGDAGGGVAGIGSEEKLREEYKKLYERVTHFAPGARIHGVVVQQMLKKIDYEVILGSKKDRVFGSVIVFGMSGIAVRIYKDFSVGLPPLNQTLARRLVEELKIYRVLTGYQDKPPADMRQLEQIIVSFSNLIVDFPEIAESDINPIAISNGVAYALNARIVLDKNCIDPPSQYPHLVIAPYPAHYILPWTLPDGKRLILRPIKPEDEPLVNDMYVTISEESFRSRFFQAAKHASHEMHIRQCNIDYDREMGIVAEMTVRGKRMIVGLGTLVTETNQKSAEYAVLVHDDYQGKGLGYKLLDVLIGIAQEKGLAEIYGFVRANNTKMLDINKRLGFIVEVLPEKIVKVRLFLK
jgi:acetyltransferase